MKPPYFVVHPDSYEEVINLIMGSGKLVTLTKETITFGFGALGIKLFKDRLISKGYTMVVDGNITELVKIKK